MFGALMTWLATPGASTLVGAGTAAVSTYAQSRNAEKMANQGTDLGKLRSEAEANGFNPLTVLRATGGQGFKQNVSMGSGALASASFFNAFAGLGQNIAQAKQQEATLKNTLASTAYYTAQSRALSTSAVSQVAAIPDNIIASIPAASPVTTSKLAVHGSTGHVVDPKLHYLYEVYVKSDGSTGTRIAGDDWGEQLVNMSTIALDEVARSKRAASGWLSKPYLESGQFDPF
jgi:hypothetical protein